MEHNKDKLYNQKVISTNVDIELIEFNNYFLKTERKLTETEKQFISVVQEIRQNFSIGQEKHLETTKLFQIYLELKRKLGIKEHRLLKTEAEYARDKIDNLRNKGYKLHQDVIRLIKNNVELDRTAFVTLTINQKYYQQKIDYIKKQRISTTEKQKRINKILEKDLLYQKQIKDITECNKLFTTQFNNFRRKHEFFKNSSYLASIEKQKNGNVHYHIILFNIDSNDFELYSCKRKDKSGKWWNFYSSVFLDKVWKYGMNDFILLTNWNVKKNREQNSLDVARYMSKYIIKNADYIKNMSIKKQIEYLNNQKHERLVLKSRNLAKFETLKTIGYQYDQELITSDTNSSFMKPVGKLIRKEIQQNKKYIKHKK